MRTQMPSQRNRRQVKINLEHVLPVERDQPLIDERGQPL